LTRETYTISRPGPNEIALNVIRVLKGSDRMRRGRGPYSGSEERPSAQVFIATENLLNLEPVAVAA